MQAPVTIVILAAGLGTRMKSKQAKVLHRAGGKALVEHVVATALKLTTADRIFVVVGHQAEQVRQAVTASTPGIGFIEQKEQKGTGHAVMIGRDVLASLDGYLMILYGDSPLLRAETLSRLIAQEQAGKAAGVLMSAQMPDPTGYGRIIRRANGHVEAIVEQKAATPAQLAIREGNMGIYCYRADLFWKHVGEIQTNNPAGEYYLTDMVEILNRAGHHVEAMEIPDATEALGINNRAELAIADRLMRDAKVRELMVEGVTIEKPETVTVDADAEIGMDTVIAPFAQVLGKSKIGENCVVGPCSIIKNSEIADGAEIGPFTLVADSKIGPSAHIGPFARLRMNAEVAENAHIGNFVELKKTKMGAGAKANHLAYLGDSLIGSKSNIGAGTITCNYDGVHKHPTDIGEGVFVGSNSTLVAPLKLGDGAYIAAGSVITDEVPSDALALGRSRQTLKPEWAKKRRELGKRKASV